MWGDGIPGGLPLIVSEIRYFSFSNNDRGGAGGRLAFLSLLFQVTEPLYELYLQMYNVTIPKKSSSLFPSFHSSSLKAGIAVLASG